MTIAKIGQGTIEFKKLDMTIRSLHNVKPQHAAQNIGFDQLKSIS